MSDTYNVGLGVTDNTRQGLDQFAENAKRAMAVLTQAQIQLANQTKQATRAMEDLGSGMRQKVSQDGTRSFETAGGAVASFVTKVGGATAVVEGLRRSFTQFADVDRQLRVIGNTLGLTRNQQKALANDLTQTGALLGQNLGKTLPQFVEFMRISGQLKDAALATFPLVAQLAASTGTNIDTMVTATGTAIKNLNLTKDEAAAVLNAWAATLGQHMGAFSAALPQLTQKMDTLGFRGKQNAIDIGAAFVTVAGQIKDVDGAGTALNTLLAQLGDRSTTVGRRTWATMQDIKQRNGSILEGLRALAQQVGDQGGFTEEGKARASKWFEITEQQRQVLQVIFTNWDSIEAKIKAAAAAANALKDNVDKITDAQQSINNVFTALNNAAVAVGNMMDKMGASAVLNAFAGTMNIIATAAGEIAKHADTIKNMLPGGGPSAPGEPPKPGLGHAIGQGVQYGAGLGAIAGIPLPGIGPMAGAAIGAVAGGVTEAGRWGINRYFGTASKSPLDIANERAATPFGPTPQQVIDDAFKQVPRMAEGGIVTQPTLAVVGEKGPERVTPLSADRVITDNTMATKDNTAAINQMTMLMQNPRGSGRRPWSSRSRDLWPDASGSSLAEAAGINDIGGAGGYRGGGGGSGGSGASGSWGGDQGPSGAVGGSVQPGGPEPYEGYNNDLAFLRERGGHDIGFDKEGGPHNAELVARAAKAGRAYEAENPGQRAKYGEMARSDAVQAEYYRKHLAGGGIAAPPGRSRHNPGRGGSAIDLPDSPFRRWLQSGQGGRFGVHFPVAGDAPHMQADPQFGGPAFAGNKPITPTADGGGAVAAAGGGDGWQNYLASMAYLESTYKGEQTGSARGQFQFTPATVADAMKAGIGDPRTGTYAEQAAKTRQFIQKFHPQAAEAIARGDYATADRMLKGRWVSLPGGSQPQAGGRYRTRNEILAGRGPRPPGEGGDGGTRVAAAPRRTRGTAQAAEAPDQDKSPNARVDESFDAMDKAAKQFDALRERMRQPINLNINAPDVPQNNSAIRSQQYRSMARRAQTDGLGDERSRTVFDQGLN